MTYERLESSALDYAPCQYGGSERIFRGPKKYLEEPYIAFLGGSEFFGKYVATPVSERISEQTGNISVNLGQMNCGLDAIIFDPGIVDLANQATVTCLQALPAHNLSNKFYAVHPKRNDRFLRPTPLLEALYPNVDFSDFHFTKHMLLSLRRVSPEKFRVVADELRSIWRARMRLLMAKIATPVILVHLVDRARPSFRTGLGQEPLFVTQDMVNSISNLANSTISYDMTQMHQSYGVSDMEFALHEKEAAAELMPAACHNHLADLLLPEIRAWM